MPTLITSCKGSVRSNLIILGNQIPTVTALVFGEDFVSTANLEFAIAQPCTLPFIAGKYHFQLCIVNEGDEHSSTGGQRRKKVIREFR
ncbi:MAG: hypothetical protein RIC80_04335 [Cyclobacteriaceae bacterium]